LLAALLLAWEWLGHGMGNVWDIYRFHGQSLAALYLLFYFIMAV
jgi:hypothetical protein